MLRPCPRPNRACVAAVLSSAKGLWCGCLASGGAFPGHCDDIGTHPLKPASHFLQLTLVFYPFSLGRSSSRWWRRPLEPAPDRCLCEDPAGSLSSPEACRYPRPEPRLPRPSDGDRAWCPSSTGQSCTLWELQHVLVGSFFPCSPLRSLMLIAGLLCRGRWRLNPLPEASLSLQEGCEFGKSINQEWGF